MHAACSRVPSAAASCCTPPPLFDHHLRLLQRIKISPFKHSSAVSVEALAIPVSQGFPGSMYSVPVLNLASRSLSSFATNSGPLSERIYSGIPRNNITSTSASITPSSQAFLPHGPPRIRQNIRRSASASAGFFRRASSRSQSHNSTRGSPALVAATPPSIVQPQPRQARCTAYFQPPRHHIRYTQSCLPASHHLPTAPNPPNPFARTHWPCSDRLGQQHLRRSADRGRASCPSPLP